MLQDTLTQQEEGVLEDLPEVVVAAAELLFLD
jgi:hypothetical protein